MTKTPESPERILGPAPVEIEIDGQSYPVAFPMHAVILYQRESARIERSRPTPEDPDPRCLCGFRKSTHTGPNLIRLGDNNSLLCAHFRAEDRLLGDSLFLFDSWMKIDLNIDPERWMACLWCGLHHRGQDGRWRAPMTIDELGEKLGLNADTRKITDRMYEALTAWFSRPATGPNAPAPGEPAQSQSKHPTSISFGPERETAGDLPPTNS